MLAVDRLDARLGEALDAGRDEVDVGLDERLEVARSGRQAPTADGEVGDERLGDMRLRSELLLHCEVRVQSQ